ncbi:sigma factor-like helix-turn-helix DNA-binding protein [Streptomyces sp. NPDC051940]|uniref:sigma factor-like helix-turn-helix DNA-binding protein n=1 Tax=Streptomyces sp. NPDC051940 TaxID=3155675 RepID=UPI0034130BB7
MGKRRAAREQERAREFEYFVAGAAGRLLHTAQLLTSEPPDAAPAAERLLTAALARTYARWDRLHGEDPYEAARQELVSRFARLAWRYRRAGGGLLGRLTPQERLVLVLRLHEGVAEEQTAAALGLAAERVHGILSGALSAALTRPAGRKDPARAHGTRAEGAAT